MSKLLEDQIKAILAGEIISEKSGDANPFAKKDANSDDEEKDNNKTADTDGDGDTEGDTDNDGDDKENGSTSDDSGSDNEDKDGDDDSDDEDKKAKYKSDTSDEPTGKGDTVNVKESQNQNEGTMTTKTIPNIGKDQTAAPADESGATKTAKTKEGLSRKLGDVVKLALGDTADKKDDNGDNARGKLTPGAAPKETGGKLPANEHMDAMFAGESLTEDFKAKAQTIFEAAVATKVQEIVEERLSSLEEDYEAIIETKINKEVEDIVEQIDGYLEKEVNEWVKGNEVAIESGIKRELSESFVDGLKNLFIEHYVSVPEGKDDIVSEQVEQITDLQEEVARLQTEKLVAENKAIMLECEKIVSELCSGLTAIEQDKFRSLTENIEFTTGEDFGTKAKTIRESYFNKYQKAGSQEAVKPIEEKVDASIADSVVAALQNGNQMKFVRV